MTRQPKDPAPAATAAPAPDRPPTLATAEAVNRAALEVMATSVDVLREQIEVIRKEPAHDDGARIASLAAKAGVIYEATRKAEAARLKRLQGVTPALVLAWYRQLDRAERDHLLGELQQIDSRRSGRA